MPTKVRDCEIQCAGQFSAGCGARAITYFPLGASLPWGLVKRACPRFTSRVSTERDSEARARETLHHPWNPPHLLIGPKRSADCGGTKSGPSPFVPPPPFRRLAPLEPLQPLLNPYLPGDTAQSQRTVEPQSRYWRQRAVQPTKGKCSPGLSCRGPRMHPNSPLRAIGELLD